MRPRILVVDDNVVDRELARRALADTYEVVEAESLAACRLAVASGPLAAIVLDHRLPDGDGFELVAELSEGGQVVILTTGMGDERLAARAIMAGASDYLPKSGLSAPALRRCVVQAVRRKRLELQLEAHDLRLGQILESLPVGVIVISRDLEPFYWNAAATRILGRGAEAWGELEQLAERYSAYRFGTDQPYPFAEMPLIAALEGVSSSVDDMEIRQSGRSVRVAVTGTPIRDASGEVEFGLAVVEDVSERHSLEAQLTQSQKMEAVARLAGGMAHDFNNQLMVMSTFTHMARDALGPDHVLYEDLEAVISAASSARDMIGRLLAFARQRPAAPVRLNVGDSVAGFLPLVERLMGTGIEVRWVEPERAATVVVDQGGLHQVLMNLAVNAKDAMDGEGTFTLELAHHEIGPEHPLGAHETLPEGPYVELSVSDTGAGMSPRVLAHATEPFFSTKPDGAGGGLGLSICFGIVQRAGGLLLLDSVEGEGTTVRVLLPEVGPSLESIAHLLDDVVAFSSAQVLVVEDEPLLRRAIERLLAERGYETHVAGDGVEALRIVDEGLRPDVIVTDVRMPRMSGPEFITEARSRGVRAEVLYVTGHAGSALEDEERLVEQGRLLYKPCEPAQLVAAVERLVGGG